MKERIKKYVEDHRKNGSYGRLLGRGFDLAKRLKISKVYSPYWSQFGQDKFVDRLSRKTSGFFVDVGAYNGKDYSNTYFLQFVRGWKGICIEPNEILFERLESTRSNSNCICYSCALDSYGGQARFIEADWWGTLKDRLTKDHEEKFLLEVKREEKVVQVRRLRDILEEQGVMHVDYLSLDTEGNELEILRGIDWSKTTFGILGVENNWGDDSIRKYLAERGYVLAEKLGVDDMYLSRELSRNHSI